MNNRATELSEEIRELLSELSHEIEKEINEQVEQMDDPVKALLYLTQLADSNRGKWSGGYTLSNMIEQETRDRALMAARYVGYKLQR
jgi:hypothetical protein